MNKECNLHTKKTGFRCTLLFLSVKQCTDSGKEVNEFCKMQSYAFFVTEKQRTFNSSLELY